MRKLISRSVMLSATFAVALLVVDRQSAQSDVTTPFKISGSGVGKTGLPLPGQDPRPHTIDDGHATHLGRHTGFGSVQTFSAAFDPDTGTIKGEFGSGDPFVFVAANGDELVCHYGREDKGADEPGTFELTIVGVTPEGALIVVAEFVAEFVPQPESTGRFAGATGGWIMYAYTDPFVLGSSDPIDYWWEGEGSLTFELPANE